MKKTKAQVNRSIAMDVLEETIKRLFDEQDLTVGRGVEGWRFPHDIALSALVAIDNAGLTFTRKRS